MKQFQMYIDTGVHTRVTGQDPETKAPILTAVDNKLDSHWWLKFRRTAKLLRLQERTLIGDGNAGLYIRENQEAVVGWSIADLIHNTVRLSWIAAVAASVSVVLGAVSVTLMLILAFAK